MDSLNELLHTCSERGFRTLKQDCARSARLAQSEEASRNTHACMCKYVRTNTIREDLTQETSYCYMQTRQPFCACAIQPQYRGNSLLPTVQSDSISFQVKWSPPSLPPSQRVGIIHVRQLGGAGPPGATFVLVRTDIESTGQPNTQQATCLLLTLLLTMTVLCRYPIQTRGLSQG